jgi:flagellin
MTISLNTNMAASKAAINLSNNQANLAKSLERLSSGKRITEASDDAGGLAVAMKLQAKIGGFKADSQSIGNGISLLQVREGALAQMSEIALRLDEIKSASAGFGVTATDYDGEVAALCEQLATLESEAFNGKALFQTAGHDILSDATTYTIADDNMATAGTGLVVAGPVDFKALTTVGSYTDADVTALIDQISKLRASNGGDMSQLQFAQDSVQNQITGLESALGRIMDVDIATESANLAKQQILVQASASMVSQANTANNVALLLLQ